MGQVLLLTPVREGFIQVLIEVPVMGICNLEALLYVFRMSNGNRTKKLRFYFLSTVKITYISTTVQQYTCT